MPFSGKLCYNKEKGIYTCAACGHELFSSDDKFESGTGWPSFYEVISSGNVHLLKDNSHSMHRIEVVCSSCGSHLGHVFEDGSTSTGKRYCINSLSLEFKKKGEKDQASEKPTFCKCTQECNLFSQYDSSLNINLTLNE